MISSDVAFDLLPIVTDIYDKIGIDEYRKQIAKQHKGKTDLDSMQLGIDLFKFVLKNSKKIKEEIFELISVFEEISIQEAKAQNFMKTVSTLKSIFTDKEANELFKQAMK